MRAGERRLHEADGIYYGYSQFYPGGRMKRRILAAAIALFVISAASIQAESREGEEEPRSPGLPVFLNILPGLGVGSFVQGDLQGGFIGLGGELVGVGLFAYGALYSYADMIGAVLTGMFGGDTSEISRDMEIHLYMALGGLVIWTGTRVFEIVRPFVYVKEYKEEHGLVKASLGPTLRPASGGFEPGLALKLSY